MKIFGEFDLRVMISNSGTSKQALWPNYVSIIGSV